MTLNGRDKAAAPSDVLRLAGQVGRGRRAARLGFSPLSGRERRSVYLRETDLEPVNASRSDRTWSPILNSVSARSSTFHRGRRPVNIFRSACAGDLIGKCFSRNLNRYTSRPGKRTSCLAEAPASSRWCQRSPFRAPRLVRGHTHSKRMRETSSTVRLARGGYLA
jgi:hypothetical protein